MKKIFFLFFLVVLGSNIFAQNYKNTYQIELRNEFEIGSPDLTPEQISELMRFDPNELKNLLFIVGQADSRRFLKDSDKMNDFLSLSRARNTGLLLQTEFSLSQELKFYSKRSNRRTVTLVFRKRPAKTNVKNEYTTIYSGVSRQEAILIADSLDKLNRPPFGLYFGGGYHLSKFNQRGLPILFLGAKYKNLLLELEGGISFLLKNIAELPEGEMDIYHQHKVFNIIYVGRFSRRSSWGYVVGVGYFRDEILVQKYDEYVEKKEGIVLTLGLNYKSIFLEGLIRSGKDLFFNNERGKSLEFGFSTKIRILN